MLVSFGNNALAGTVKEDFTDSRKKRYLVDVNNVDTEFDLALDRQHLGYHQNSLHHRNGSPSCGFALESTDIVSKDVKCSLEISHSDGAISDLIGLDHKL